MLALVYRPPAQSIQTNQEIYTQMAELRNIQDTVAHVFHQIR